MYVRSLSGIHALPVELLTRIIILGANDDHPYSVSPFLLKPVHDYYPVPSTQFQLTASHVCRYWRHVALRTPSLWTTLCFRECSHIPRAEAYLARCSLNPNRRLDILVHTVAPEEHIPGVTLCQEELPVVFSLIMPHVSYWRAFHLKIRDNICKQQARQNLGNCGPAPNLETLQLYHFENFRTTQNLYIATYRPPVKIFSNSLPKLRNVSLIGVNLPWDQSPYLLNLHTLEFALHAENIRPPYKYWDSMLRHSPALQRLFLHYSGPKNENGTEDLAWTPLADEKGKGREDENILLESLWELSLTDLDPDFLCLVLSRLVMPNVRKLTLHLPDQDFSPFVELIAPCSLPPDPAQPPASSHPDSYSESSSSHSPGGSASPISSWDTHSSGSSTPVHSPTLTSVSTSSSLASSITTTASISVSPMTNNGSTLFKRFPFPGLSTTLGTLIITALECSFSNWTAFIRSLLTLTVLEVNFGKISTRGSDASEGASWTVLIERVAYEIKRNGEVVRRERMVLPELRTCKVAGLSGEAVRTLVTERGERSREVGSVSDVEWLVVEDRDARRDKELIDIFERGLWIGGDDGKRWTGIRKVVKEEEEEGEEEEEEDGGEEDDESEEEEGGYMEEDDDDNDAEEEDAEELEVLAEQNYLMEDLGIASTIHNAGSASTMGSASSSSSILL